MISCKECEHWHGGEESWRPCSLLLLNKSEGGRLEVNWRCMAEVETVLTREDYGCAWGEKGNPRCPDCDSRGEAIATDRYNCPNGYCRVVTFKEKSQFTFKEESTC